MEKVCPKCSASFTCRVDNILECRCVEVPLTAEARAFIADNYANCLCYNCLVQVSKHFRKPERVNI